MSFRPIAEDDVSFTVLDSSGQELRIPKDFSIASQIEPAAQPHMGMAMNTAPQPTALPEPMAEPEVEPHLEMPPDDLSQPFVEESEDTPHLEMPEDDLSQPEPTGAIQVQDLGVHKPESATDAAAMGVRGMVDAANAQQEAADAQAAGLAEQARARQIAEEQIAEQQRQRAEQAKLEQAREEELLGEKSALVEKYANHKVSRGRHFANLSTGQKIGTWIGVALAGLAAAQKGQQGNPALDMVLKFVDQDVQLQMADREKMGRAIGFKGDEIADFRAASRTRLAEYNTRTAALLSKLDRDIASIQERTNSRVVKANAGAIRGELQQRITGSLATAAKADRDEEFRIQEADRAEKARRRSAWLQRRGQDMSQARYEQDRQDKWEQFKMGLAQKEAEARAKGDAHAAAQAKQIRELGIGDADGNPMVNKDGTTFIARNAKVAESLAKKKSAVDMSTSIIDRLLLARRKHGWSSDLFASDEWRAMKADFGALQISVKDSAELGALVGKDFEILDSMLGTGDPTEARDPTEGLRRFRKNVVEKFNKDLRVAQYRGERYDPPRIEESKAAERGNLDNMQIIVNPSEIAMTGGTDAESADLGARLAALDELSMRYRDNPKVAKQNFGILKRAVLRQSQIPQSTKERVLRKLELMEEKATIESRIGWHGWKEGKIGTPADEIRIHEIKKELKGL